VKPEDGRVASCGLVQNPFSRFSFAKVEFGPGKIDECATQLQVGQQEVVTALFAFGYELVECGVVHTGILTAHHTLVGDNFVD